MDFVKKTSIVFLAMLFLCSLSRAQQVESSDANLDSEIESIRADIKADKVTIITDVMKFKPEESAAFWPIYKKYEYDLGVLNDERVKLVKAYADKYTTLSDEDAKQMSEKAFDL